MKSSGKFYLRLLIVIVAGFVFFFSTKLWLPDDRDKQSIYYNEVLQEGDWMVRFQDAEYDPASQKMRVEILQKALYSDPQNYKLKVYKGNVQAKVALPFELEQEQDNPNVCWLEISKIPKDYYYISIVFTTQSQEYPADTSSSADSQSGVTDNDIFASGATTTSAVSTDTKTIKIDYRKVKIVQTGTSSTIQQGGK